MLNLIGCLVQVSLEFVAPFVTGQYQYTAVLTSDSYIELSFEQEVIVREMSIVQCNCLYFVQCNGNHFILVAQFNVHKKVLGMEQWLYLEYKEVESKVLEDISEKESN